MHGECFYSPLGLLSVHKRKMYQLPRGNISHSASRGSTTGVESKWEKFHLKFPQNHMSKPSSKGHIWSYYTRSHYKNSLICTVCIILKISYNWLRKKEMWCAITLNLTKKPKMGPEKNVLISVWCLLWTNTKWFRFWVSNIYCELIQNGLVFGCLLWTNTKMVYSLFQKKIFFEINEVHNNIPEKRTNLLAWYILFGEFDSNSLISIRYSLSQDNAVKWLSII